MKWQRTFLAAIVFIALLFLYLVDTATKETREKIKEEAEKIFLEWTPETVQKITLKNEQGMYELEKRVDRWTIIHPILTDADQHVVDTLLSAILEGRRFNPFTTEDLKEYGLDASDQLLSLSDGQTSRTLALGSGAVTPGRLFAHLRSDRLNVFTIGTYLQQHMNKSLYDLRDKRILKIVPDLEVSLFLKNDKGAVRASKNENGVWKIESPGEYRADEDAIKEVLTTLSAARFEHIDDAPEEFNEYGLDTPRIVCEVEQKTQDTIQTFTLLIGNAVSDQDRSYAMHKDDTAVMELGSTIVSLLEQDLRNLRDKSLFTLTYDEVDRVETLFRGESVELIKDETGLWTLAKGDTTRIDQDAVAIAVNDMLAVKSVSFTEDNPDNLLPYGLVQPKIIVHLEDSDTSHKETIEISKMPPDNNGMVHVRIVEKNGIVAIEWNKVRKLYLTRKDILDKHILRFNPNDVFFMNVKEEDSTYTLSRKEGLWQLSSQDGTTAAVPASEVNALLLQLTQVEGEEPVWEGATQKNVTGIDNPKRAVTIFTANHETLAMWIQGKTGDETGFISNGEDTFIVNNPAIGSVAALLQRIVGIHE